MAACFKKGLKREIQQNISHNAQKTILELVNEAITIEENLKHKYHCVEYHVINKTFQIHRNKKTFAENVMPAIMKRKNVTN